LYSKKIEDQFMQKDKDVLNYFEPDFKNKLLKNQMNIEMSQYTKDFGKKLERKILNEKDTSKFQ